MKRITGLVYIVALLICWLVGTLAWAQSDQPSLADIARQKSTAKARRVVTNDEIPPSPEADNPPPSSSAAVSASAASPGTKPGAPNDAAKVATSSETTTRLQVLMKERESLEKIIKQLQEKIDASDDQNRITTLNEALKHAKEALEENQKEIDKLKSNGAAAGQSGDSEPAPNPAATSEPGPAK
jgi:DNA-binding transcriptional MerR regulator